jgi:hypothetical protein
MVDQVTASASGRLVVDAVVVVVVSLILTGGWVELVGMVDLRERAGGHERK